MTTTARTLALTTLLAGLLGFAGCAPPEEPAALGWGTEGEPSAAADRPVAPPPGPAVVKVADKTTAELLVGEWAVVKNNPPFNRPVAMTAVFTKDGRFIFRIMEPQAGVAVNKGKYQVIGQSIRLSSDPSEELPAGRTWNVDIESITEQELKTVGGPPTNRERMTSKRVDGR